jgi:3',5'-cyclic AMP phosphodiesterase CpdA
MAASRIWDMRRGDYDDDRASPYGRGMRKVVLSAALEFNILKAAIGFLTLIAGPALLLGVTPSIVFTYGSLKFRAASMARSQTIAALLLTLFLVAILVRLGRPFLRAAHDSFWHLRYTLILPIFVVLREIVRKVCERASGASNNPHQIHRIRQVSTALAASIFATLGIVVALKMELSTGLQIVDVERVRPWAVAMAALGNAVIILSVACAAESLHWLRRELTLPGPAGDWSPPPTVANAATVRVAHLSDLHVVSDRYGLRMETGTRGPRGNSYIRRALEQIARIHDSAPLDRILVTGDVTDAGIRQEWTAFLDLLRAHPDLRARVSFIPGNHDVNIVDRTNPGRMDLPGSATQALRKLRTVLALDAVQGDRSRLIDPVSGSPGPTLREYLREGDRAEALRALARSGDPAARKEMTRIWDRIFPLVEPADAGGCGLILLDSNARSHFSLTNAIGVIGRRQRQTLKLILRNSTDTASIILLHHQLIEYPGTSVGLRDRIGLALINAPDVLAAIAPHASRVMVLHGHRHWDWIGACANLTLCSAPSVSLGSYNKCDRRGGFYIYQAAVGASGVIQLMAFDRVSVA